MRIGYITLLLLLMFALANWAYTQGYKAGADWGTSLCVDAYVVSR